MIYLLLAIIAIFSLKMLKKSDIYKILVAISVIFMIVRFSAPISIILANMTSLFFRFADKIISISIIAPLIIKLYMIFKRLYQQRSFSQKNEMSFEEAKEIFELSENFTKEDIIKSYHRLMSINHPDKGGSIYFAQKINQAKTILIKNFGNYKK